MNIRWLQKEELHLVKPKFREMVTEAWANNESVPFGVIYLSESDVSERDIEWAQKMLKKYDV